MQLQEEDTLPAAVCEYLFWHQRELTTMGFLTKYLVAAKWRASTKLDLISTVCLSVLLSISFCTFAHLSVPVAYGQIAIMQNITIANAAHLHAAIWWYYLGRLGAVVETAATAAAPVAQPTVFNLNSTSICSILHFSNCFAASISSPSRPPPPPYPHRARLPNLY